MRYRIKDDPTPFEAHVNALGVLRAMRDRTPLDRDLGDHAWIDRLAERALAWNYSVDPPASIDPAEVRAEHLLAEMIRVGLVVKLVGEAPAEEVAHA